MQDSLVVEVNMYLQAHLLNGAEDCRAKHLHSAKEKSKTWWTEHGHGVSGGRIGICLPYKEKRLNCNNQGIFTGCGCFRGWPLVQLLTLCLFETNLAILVPAQHKQIILITELAGHTSWYNIQSYAPGYIPIYEICKISCSLASNREIAGTFSL